jgi:hypothetical protein
MYSSLHREKVNPEYFDEAMIIKASVVNYFIDESYHKLDLSSDGLSIGEA